MTVKLDVVLDSFVARVPEVAHAVAMSTDGQVLATTSSLPESCRERLAAVGASIAGLLHGAATSLDTGQVISHIVHMDGGFMFTMRLSPHVSLLVVASTDCDVAQVGQELPQLATWVSPDPLEFWTPSQPPAEHGQRVATLRGCEP